MMEFLDGIKAIGMILVVMAFIAMVEAVIPLHRRNSWSKSHIVPNLAVTLVTFGTNLFLNAPILIGLLWLEANGYGLFNLFAMNPVVEIIASVLVLDLAWYATHVTMHKVPSLWPYHVVHHSDPFVDMTTTARQHPGESLLRYVFLAGFGFTCGVSPAGFAAYKIWQVLSGMLEHSNLRFPQWLETSMNVLISSPSMHKVHHSRDERFADRNYGNIFTIWDRMFGTFVHSKYGRDIDYGVIGEDAAEQQTALGLLKRPFVRLSDAEVVSTDQMPGQPT